MLQHDKISEPSKFKTFANDKITLTQKFFVFFLKGGGRKHCGKRRKCWLPAFSHFPTMFSKSFSFGVLSGKDCMVKD